MPASYQPPFTFLGHSLKQQQAHRRKRRGQDRRRQGKTGGGRRDRGHLQKPFNDRETGTFVFLDLHQEQLSRNVTGNAPNNSSQPGAGLPSAESRRAVRSQLRGQTLGVPVLGYPAHLLQHSIWVRWFPWVSRKCWANA